MSPRWGPVAAASLRSTRAVCCKSVRRVLALNPVPCATARAARPTTTDANLALGRLNPDYFLGGRVPLDPKVALPALREIGLALGADEAEAVETASHAIVDTANENMANQIRLIAVDRGLDAREFTLVPFGGAGPVHGRSCAELLGIRRMLVPPHPGLSSAFGAAVAHLRADRTQTFVGRLGSLDLQRFQTCSIPSPAPRWPSWPLMA